MLKDNFNDLLSFMVVARERSFTRAAAQLYPRRGAAWGISVGAQPRNAQSGNEAGSPSVNPHHP